MTLKGDFKGGWHEGLNRMPARWTGGSIAPTLVVLHDTASRLSDLSAARYLADNSRKVSVHFVVERDGTVTQQVPIDRRANHAGRSHYHGRDGCNGFSIGIEIVNPGKLVRKNAHMATAWYGEDFRIKDFGIEEASTPEHGAGLWMAYTEEQIGALDALLHALFDEVGSLTDLRTHWYVSPGRKIDTNPLFPLEHLRSRVMGREDWSEDAADEGSAPAPLVDDDNSYVEIETPGDALNMRRWPSFNPNVIARIPDGVAVPVLREGRFGGRRWLKVFYGGQEGWIVARYAAPVMVEA